MIFALEPKQIKIVMDYYNAPPPKAAEFFRGGVLSSGTPDENWDHFYRTYSCFFFLLNNGGGPSYKKLF